MHHRAVLIVLHQLRPQRGAIGRVAAAEVRQFMCQYRVSLGTAEHAQQRQTDKQRAPLQCLVGGGERRFGHEKIGVDACNNLLRRRRARTRSHVTDVRPQYGGFALRQRFAVDSGIARRALEQTVHRVKHRHCPTDRDDRNQLNRIGIEEKCREPERQPHQQRALHDHRSGTGKNQLPPSGEKTQIFQVPIDATPVLTQAAATRTRTGQQPRSAYGHAGDEGNWKTF